MTSETVTPLETMSVEVGLMVMQAIMLDGHIERRESHAVITAQNELEAMMKEADCVQLSEAMYFYEKATGKFDPTNTYLR